MIKIIKDKIYYFSKSGNRVQTVKPTTYGGRDNWIVRRVEGVSAGKEMIVSASSLVNSLD